MRQGGKPTPRAFEWLPGGNKSGVRGSSRQSKHASHSAFHHGEAFVIPWMSLTEADGIAYRFGMAAFIHMERGLPVRMVVTG